MLKEMQVQEIEELTIWFKNILYLGLRFPMHSVLKVFPQWIKLNVISDTLRASLKVFLGHLLLAATIVRERRL